MLRKINWISVGMCLFVAVSLYAKVKGFHDGPIGFSSGA
jgi:hypothetical protein